MVSLFLIVAMLLFQSCTKDVEDSSEGMECWAVLNLQKLGVQSVTGDMVLKACETINKPLIDKDVSSPEGIQHEIAMNMARAWKITHEGTIKEEMWDTDLVDLFKSGSECMIIYKLRFNPTPLFGMSYPGITYQQMDNYFAQEYYASFPRTDGKQGELRYTFAEYVQSKGGEGAYLFPDEDANGIIKPGEVYAISVGSPDAPFFGKSKLSADTNIVMFSTYQYAIGQKMGCREFVD